MAIQSYKMGPGTLTLGAGGAQDVSAQVRACTVACSESSTTEDAIPVLTGEEIPEEEAVTLAWSIAGSFLQDIAVAGLVAYTWANASEEVPFEFVPNTAAGRQVTGTCRLVPLSIGGDVKSRPTTDFEWKIVDTPVLGDVG